MAPQEYSWEVRQRAWELYVYNGLTFDQVAEATGVSASQLKRWSAEEKAWEAKRFAGGDADATEYGKDWPEARKEFRLAQGSILGNSMLLRAKLIKNALGDPEFKRVLSAAMWEKTQAGKDVRAKGEASGASPEPPDTLPVINAPADAVLALDKLVNRKIGQMANQPGTLNFQAVKDLKQTLALIEELKAKYQPEEKTGQAPGLSDETAEEIRRQFLGVG